MYYRDSGCDRQPPTPILPTCLPKIRQALSDARLDGFRAANSESDLDLLTRYAWNMALSAALYVPLHLLEVALRNTLHDTLTLHHGGNRHWYRLPLALPPPYRSKPGPNQRLTRTELQIRDAIAEATKATQPMAHDEPGRVVAALNFGFWTSLLSPPWGSPRSAAQHWQPLWPRYIPQAFPGFPSTGKAARDRQTLSERFDNLRKLRNRISHHEPIWRGRPVQGTQRRVLLSTEYQEILEAIGWISAELLGATNALSIFPHVLAAGPVPYRAMLSRLP